MRASSLPVLLLIALGHLVACGAPTPSPQAAPAAQPTSTAAAAGQYQNPILDVDFPDPAVIDGEDGYYYAYATQTIVPSGTINIQLARSRDLVRWEARPDALPVKPAWASQTQKFWAPDVSKRDGKFFMYYSAEPNENGGLCLAVAIADKPEGPFTDIGKPLQCGETFVNIDPMAFDDPKTKKRLLYWGSAHKPIRVRELAPSRTEFLPGSAAVDMLAVVDGPHYEKLIEGAYLIERAGTYYLFYSGDNCCGDKAHYAVLVARSSSALGPFEKMGKALNVPSSVIVEANDHWVAPGHNSILRDAAGNDWIFYHAINPKKRLLRQDSSYDPTIPGDRDVRRVMLMDRIEYRDGWPRIDPAGPSLSPRPAPVIRR
jgi:arabinan endo-1,5-alpha-L-arabinosidase